MTISQIKKNAKSAMKGHYLLTIAILLVQALLMSAAAGVTFGIVALLIAGPLSFGVSLAFLTVVRKQPLNFGTLFKGFEQFGTTCIAGILQSIFIFLWTLVFYIPGIVKTYSYSMTFFVIKDNAALSANQAITESRKIMNGNKMKLFLLDLSFIGWYILSSLTLGILLLYVIPYHYAARAQFYETIKGNTAA